MNWINTNAPASLMGTAYDSWMSYLAANGGTSGTVTDREHAFLTTQSVTNVGSLHDRWARYLTAQAGNSVAERARSLYH
jgi:hypothetical protein